MNRRPKTTFAPGRLNAIVVEDDDDYPEATIPLVPLRTDSQAGRSPKSQVSSAYTGLQFAAVGLGCGCAVLLMASAALFLRNPGRDALPDQPRPGPGKVNVAFKPKEEPVVPTAAFSAPAGYARSLTRPGSRTRRSSSSSRSGSRLPRGPAS